MSGIDVNDRVRVHPKRSDTIYRMYPWLRQSSWFTVTAVEKRGRRRIVHLQNPAGEERALLWMMDVRKPRPGAERKLAAEAA